MAGELTTTELEQLRVENGRLRTVLDVLMNRVEATSTGTGSVLGLFDVTSTLSTQVKQQQQHLREALQRAEQASKAKGLFLANMSHEIRTPMTAILGFIALIEDGCVRHCSFGRNDMADHIATIRRNGEQLLSIINDILDLSKIETGQLALEQTRINPAEVLADVRKLMQSRAEAKNIELTVETIGEIPETIAGDARRLRQMLVSVVGNAIKFTEAGRVTIRLGHQRSGEHGSVIEYRVIDTGIGMDTRQVEELFQPFTQADISTTRRFGGTGLGLTLSKRLAETLGGDIYCEQSTPNQGSCFVVRLPTGPIEPHDRASSVSSEQAAAAQSEPESPCASVNGCRVLLVEDGPDNQRLISTLLRRAEAMVQVAENGRVGLEKALEAWRSGQPHDVVLMDMQMPVLGGYDATRELRAAGYGQPIIALTAHAMSDDREKCLAAGCDAYLTKPIDRTTLINAIAAARACGTPQHPSVINPPR